ncbi:unnamed protein product [Spirodela intermedia]|uniref:Uncharacterized protein n=1 Tax=Spirodela intermedia TaxID=51605 RepID=A0A7I8KMM6_SPIIN|nr:unnamed protein product [Spirodela intermedia]
MIPGGNPQLSKSVSRLYNTVLAYGQSKFANILHANELSRRLKVPHSATTCYAALHPQVCGVSGKYFGDCHISKPSSKAKDQELGRKLWEFTAALVGPLSSSPSPPPSIRSNHWLQ